MTISVEQVKELRQATAAPVLDCKKALQNTGGDFDLAVDWLRQKGLSTAAKKAGRQANEGVVDAYIHPGSRVGVIVEVNCETDFVARTDEVKELIHNIAMQVAAMNAKFISKSDMPKSEEEDSSKICLLEQQYIKDPSITIQDLLNDVIAKVGENIQVTKIVRFALGE